MNLNFLKSAFDRIGSQSEQLKQIAAATETTAAAVTAGGVLYTKVDEMVILLRKIAENGMASSKEALKDAKVLGLVGKAMEPLGKGFQLVVAALNELPNADEAKKKIDALVGGLVKLKDVGQSILQFAGYMILAAPLLMVAAIASPLLLISLFFITKGIEMVNNRVDLEGIKKFKALGDVGKSILLLGGSLALFGLIGPLAIKGAFFAGISLLIIGGTFALLDKMKLGGKEMQKKGEALKEIGISLFALGGSLALIGLFGGLVLQGAFVASIAVLAIGGVFFLLDKLKVLDKIETGAKGLAAAALSILALGISLALFDLVAPEPKKILQIGAVIAGTAVAFGIIGIFGDTILKGAKAMGFAALAILGLGLSLYFFDMLIPGDILNMETFKAFIVIGAIGAGFLLAGKGAALIAKGALAMLVAGIAMVVIGAGIYILNAALPKENAWERIGQMGAIISGLALVMAAAGAAAVFIIPGAAAMIVAGVAMLAVAGGIAVLSSLNIEKLFKSGGLFANSGQKTTGFLGIGGGRPKTNMEVMFESIADSFSINPISLVAIYAGAPLFIMAGLALLTIGVGISKFQKIAEKADLKSLNTNVNLIVSSLANTFGKIGTLYPGGAASIFSGGSTVAHGISATRGMGDALTGIALGVQAMADLKFPTAYDKNGKPIAFETVDIPTKIKQVANNIKLILLGEDGVSGLVATFANVGKANGPDRGLFTSTDYEKGIGMIRGIGNPLLSLAKGVQMMADLRFPTGYDKDGNPTGFVDAKDVPTKLKQVEENIKLILLGEDGASGLVGIFKKLGADDDSSWFSSSTIEKGANIAAMIADPIEAIAEAATKLMEGTWDATSAAEKIKVLIGALTSGNDTDQNILNAKSNLWTKAGDSYEKMGGSVPHIIKALNTVSTEGANAFRSVFFGPIDPKDPTSSYNAQANTWDKIGVAMPRIGDNMEITSKAINSMDLEKLTEARTMFEALAALTHGGDANNILSKMGESLETALQNLAEMLNNFRDTVEDGNTGQQNILENVSSTVSSLKENISLASSATANTDQNTAASQNNIDMSSVVRAIEDLENVLVQQGVRVRTGLGD